MEKKTNNSNKKSLSRRDFGKKLTATVGGTLVVGTGIASATGLKNLQEIEKVAPNTYEHEGLVKENLKNSVQRTIQSLQKLDLIEADNLRVGKATLAFRFNAEVEKREPRDYYEKREAREEGPVHEGAIKDMLQANVESTVRMLQKLELVEVKNLEVGNSVLMFRFRRGR